MRATGQEVVDRQVRRGARRQRLDQRAIALFDRVVLAGVAIGGVVEGGEPLGLGGRHQGQPVPCQPVPGAGGVHHLAGGDVAALVARLLDGGIGRVDRRPRRLALGLVRPAAADIGLARLAGAAHEVGEAELVGSGAQRIDRGRMQPVAALVPGEAEARRVGIGAPAGARGGLDHHHVDAGLVQPAAGGKPRRTGADDDHVMERRHGHFLRKVSSRTT